MRPGWDLGTTLFVAGVTVYVAGLVFWLAIGLLPTLARDNAQVHHWVSQVASHGGLWRPYARRVLQPPMAMMVSASGLTVASQYLFSLLNLALGLLLVSRLAASRVPRLLAFAPFGTAATFNHPSHQLFDIIGQPPAIKVLHFAFHVVSGVTYLWAVVLFPDGSLPMPVRPSRRSLRITVVAITAAATLVCVRCGFQRRPTRPARSLSQFATEEQRSVSSATTPPTLPAPTGGSSPTWPVRPGWP